MPSTVYPKIFEHCHRLPAKHKVLNTSIVLKVFQVKMSLIISKRVQGPLTATLYYDGV